MNVRLQGAVLASLPGLLAALLGFQGLALLALSIGVDLLLVHWVVQVCSQRRPVFLDRVHWVCMGSSLLTTTALVSRFPAWSEAVTGGRRTALVALAIVSAWSTSALLRPSPITAESDRGTPPSPLAP